MEIPSLSALQSWKIRHCGHWSCSSSVDGVCAHPCSPACCPRGHFLQRCMGVQQHCLPCAVGCAQKTWHSAENLTVLVCLVLSPLEFWSGPACELWGEDWRAEMQGLGGSWASLGRPSQRCLGRVPAVTKHKETMRIGTTTVQCAACPWQQSWKSFRQGKYTQKP